MTAAPPHLYPDTSGLPFQKRVVNWLMACFSMEVCRDGIERNHRFLEEALELVQSLECTRSEAHQLVDYVFDRPVGKPIQELGGALVTLTALANCHDMDLAEAGETELARVWTKIDKIRAKQAAKPKHSPLPQHIAPAQRPADCGAKPGTQIAYEVMSTHSLGNIQAGIAEAIERERVVLAQGQPNLKQIEAAIDDHLGNIDATYEDSRRRCAQSILNLYALPSTKSKCPGCGKIDTDRQHAKGCPLSSPARLTPSSAHEVSDEN